ncbi:MAG: hypothetical protein JWM63_1083 [Gammaproteobacteria bacterium]|nr:hypothetical protein [Gammaproteobacteria bacterium]
MTEREQAGRNARRVRAHPTCVAVAVDLYNQGPKLGCHVEAPVGEFVEVPMAAPILVGNTQTSSATSVSHPDFGIVSSEGFRRACRRIHGKCSPAGGGGLYSDHHRWAAWSRPDDKKPPHLMKYTDTHVVARPEVLRGSIASLGRPRYLAVRFPVSERPESDPERSVAHVRFWACV